MQKNKDKKPKFDELFNEKYIKANRNAKKTLRKFKRIFFLIYKVKMHFFYQ